MTKEEIIQFINNNPVFALPGNPVSTLVCFVRYVLPAIETAMGLKTRTPLRIPLAQPIEFKADLCWFLPVRIDSAEDGTACATPCPTNTSGDFIGLRNTDGFVALPREQDKFAAGYAARFFAW